MWRKINHALYTQLKQLNTEFVKQKHLINIQEASGGWKKKKKKLVQQQQQSKNTNILC